ncbi:hypothetical protein JL722_8333 [Aureococcus anophagefferens]|nr:hypothetical protein JL722_8333 [Aureococcus anophagefferens]
MTSLVDVVLPAGDDAAIEVTAIDALGGEALASTTVDVATASADEAYDAAAEQLDVAAAFSNAEATCQTVVAAARKSSGELSRLLVDAVAGVAAKIDSDPPLVEQAAAAVRAIDLAALDADAAETALDATRQLADASVAVGVTDAAAASLVGAVPGEYSSTVSSRRVRVGSRRVSANATSTSATVAVGSAGAPATGSASDVDVALAQIDAPGDDNATDAAYVAVWDVDEMATPAPSTAPRGSSVARTVSVDISLNASVEAPETWNATCPCGFEGTLNRTCAITGDVLFANCGGTEETVILTCPGTRGTCTADGAVCQESDEGVCACEFALGAGADVSVSIDAVASLVAYLFGVTRQIPTVTLAPH